MSVTSITGGTITGNGEAHEYSFNNNGANSTTQSAGSKKYDNEIVIDSMIFDEITKEGNAKNMNTDGGEGTDKFSVQKECLLNFEKEIAKKGFTMIAAVKQNVKSIWVYDEHGRILFNKIGDLVGYTNETISIRSSSGTIWTYDKWSNL